MVASEIALGYVRVSCFTFLVLLTPVIPFQYLPLQDALVPAEIVRYLPAGICLFLLMIALPTSAGQRRTRVVTVLALLSVLVGGLGLFSGTQLGGSVSRAWYYAITGELLLVSLLGSRLGISNLRFLLILHCIAAVTVGAISVAETLVGFDAYRANVFTAGGPLDRGIGSTGTGRAIASVGNPLPLGTYLAMSIPLFIDRVLSISKLRDKALAFAGLVVVTVGVYCTFSRAAYVAAVLGVGAYLYLRRKSMLRWLAVVCTAVVIANLEAASLANRNFYDNYILNFSANPRVLGYAHATEIWIKSPIFGEGVGAYRRFAAAKGIRNATPDNLYLLMLAERGLLGLLMYLGVLLSCGALLRVSCCPIGRDRQDCTNQTGGIDKGRDQGTILAITCGLGGFVFSCLAWDGLRFPLTRMIFFLLIGIALCLANKADEDPHASLLPPRQA